MLEAVLVPAELAQPAEKLEPEGKTSGEVVTLPILWGTRSVW
jgi:hypothetical protein